MNRLRLHTCCLAHPFGGPTGGCGKQDAHTCRLQGSDDGFGRSSLSRTWTTCEYHHFRSDGLSDGFHLHFVVFNARLLTHFNCLPSEKAFPLSQGDIAVMNRVVGDEMHS